MWPKIKSSKKARVAELAENHPHALAKAAYKAQQVSGIEGNQFITTKTTLISLPIKINPTEALSLKIQCDLSDE